MELPASLSVPFDMIILLIIVSVFVAEKLNHKPNRSSNAKRTTYLMRGVMVSHATWQVLSIILAITCVHCQASWAAAWSIRAVMKGITLLFLGHRAKLAQGMVPILSKKWFEKIIPRFIIAQMFCMVLSSIYAAYTDEFQCTLYPDDDNLEFCTTAENASEDSNIIGWIFILFDFWVTGFLMTLFAVPLRRMYRADLGILNANQLKQREKLKELLSWSIVLTAINQVTSIVAVIYLMYRWGDTQSNGMYALWAIGQSDAGFNVWTSWLMLSRNRQYLQRCVCCRKIGGLQKSAAATSDLTDVSSGVDRRRFERMTSQGSAVRDVSEVTLTEQERAVKENSEVAMIAI